VATAVRNVARKSLAICQSDYRSGLL
jgi:hypothetical protein